MKRYIAICGLAAATMMLPACATVTRGTKQKFVIETTPSEAQVALSNGVTCTTPCKLKLKRKPGFDARFTKAGYQPAEVHVRSKFSGGGAAAGAGNIIAGGIIGGIIDGSNGSMNNLEPNPLRVELVPIAAAAAPAAETMEAEEAAPADPGTETTAEATAEVAAESAPNPGTEG